MKKFKVTYLSGQSVILIGNSLEEVTIWQNKQIKNFQKFNPSIGIAEIVAI